MNEQRASQTSSNVGGYRSRYAAFISQRYPGKREGKTGGIFGLSQSFINFAIFVGLVIAILTLLGFGLSRLSANQEPLAESLDQAEKKTPIARSEELMVPPTVYPSGHSVATERDVREERKKNSNRR